MNLHGQLFSEEYDYFDDSYSDARDRAAGKSPMNKDYQEKVRKKRALLGVDQLSESGMPMSELSDRQDSIRVTNFTRDRG